MFLSHYPKSLWKKKQNYLITWDHQTQAFNGDRKLNGLSLKHISHTALLLDLSMLIFKMFFSPFFMRNAVLLFG